MTFRKKYVYSALLLMLLLLLGAGIYMSENKMPPDGEKHDLTVIAGFSWEDGLSLTNNTVRFSSGKGRTDHPLNRNGELQISGLPRQGDLLLTVLDQQGQALGAMTLSFSKGAVIDATTGEDGIGHITLRDDTDVVALFFSLAEDGSLQCRLWLTRSNPPAPGLQRKGT